MSTFSQAFSPPILRNLLERDPNETILIYKEMATERNVKWHRPRTVPTIAQLADLLRVGGEARQPNSIIVSNSIQQPQPRANERTLEMTGRGCARAQLKKQ